MILSCYGFECALSIKLARRISGSLKSSQSKKEYGLKSTLSENAIERRRSRTHSSLPANTRKAASAVTNEKMLRA
jgi:hypothetical protein